MNDENSVSESAIALRTRLLALAHHEEDLAADEAAATPYWRPCPPSVLAHRLAAALLREEADLLLVGGVQ